MKQREIRSGKKRRAPTAKPAPPVKPELARAVEPRAAFPIVGVGASAGGLEALGLFLKHVPERSGMAFVVIQHQDPHHVSGLPELLQRQTTMSVLAVRDRMAVRPDTVYVLPPNKAMSILHGTLHLFKPAPGLRLPVDFFFRALAGDLREQCAGVILSGMGADGLLGISAVKEQGGVVLAQDPATAAYDSMPRHAVDSGLVDIVAAAADLPARLVAYFQCRPMAGRPEEPGLESAAESALEKIVLLLRTQTGHDFSMYKKGTLYRRVERRMGIHQIDKIRHYVQFLQDNPKEGEILFNEILIGVTKFFRDPEAWEQLKQRVIAPLVAGRSMGGPLRAWVAGCSTGEEAYSLAMVYAEALAETRPARNLALQIFATDLDRSAIAKARLGLYPANIAADVTPERLARFFRPNDHGAYVVSREIREMAILAPHNLLTDPPFTKLDVLICRNLLIYFGPELQKKLLPLFHYSLNSGGALFLGTAETIGAGARLFAPIDGKWRIYQRQPGGRRQDTVLFPAMSVPAPGRRPAALPAKPAANLQTLADQLILQNVAPAAVMVTAAGDIVYVSGRTGKYLEPAAGRANWNLFAMAREELRADLAGLFEKVRSRNAVGRAEATVRVNGHDEGVRLMVQRLEAPEELRGMRLVVFTEVSLPAARPRARPGQEPASTPRAAELQRTIRQLQAEVQAARQEIQGAQEEFRATNEELQSANEELQSANEELTSSKEEMQSLNEELQTVNAELQAKVEDLARTNSDMKNIFNSTEIATLFLDGALNVRRYTPSTARVIKLIPGDVGRPITDISSALLYPNLADDAREVLRTLMSIEKAVPTTDGRWFLVRIMPYRTTEDKIEGVVITFLDATAARQQETELRQAYDRLQEKVTREAAP